MSKIMIEIDTDNQSMSFTVDGTPVENVSYFSGYKDACSVSISFTQYEGDYRNGVRTEKCYTSWASATASLKDGKKIKGFTEINPIVQAIAGKIPVTKSTESKVADFMKYITEKKV